MRRLFFAPLAVISLLGVTFIFSKKPEPLEKRFHPERQPFAYVLPNIKPVAGVGGRGYRASDCGQCHRQIYREWQRSTHAQALHDIQFQSELTKKDSPRWLCLNCHIPVGNQREKLVTGLYNNDVLQPAFKKNPAFDYSFQQEGISCATCHIRNNARGESIIIGTRGSKLAPHPVKKDGNALTNMCQRCHNPQGEAITPNLVCWFTTFEETTSAAAAGYQGSTNCASCHMPQSRRRLSTLFTHLPKRKNRKHHWVGSGIPKWYGSYKHLEKRGYRSALRFTQQPPKLKESNWQVDVTVKNQHAAHMVPTADPERFILLIARLKNRAGVILAERKNRIGQTWQWNPARKMADNRLRPAESRPLAFTLPNKQGATMIEVMAYHVRLSSKNAQHIKAAQNVNEQLLPRGQYYVQNVFKYYPMANVIYKSQFSLQSGRTKIFNQRQLIRLSAKEAGRPQRDY